ncbi:MAG: glycosyltransferase family 9 protein [Candidatus Woesearchaeota archaeon]
MNILIIKTGALGDVLRTSVILEGLIEKYVHPKIYWLTSEAAKSLLENNPFIKKLFFSEQLEEDLFDISFDLVISLEEDKSILALLERIHAKKTFGVYLKEELVVYTPDSAPWYHMSLVSSLGKSTADELKKSNRHSYPELLYTMLGLRWSFQRYRIFLNKNSLQYARILESQIPQDSIVIGLVVGAGSRWPMKALPLETQIAFVRKIHSKYPAVKIILLHGLSELELSHAVLRDCPYVINHDIHDLNEFIGIVNLCDCIITPDTLSMHIGIALTKYVVTYFTVTSAQEIEVYTGSKLVAQHPDYCTYTKEDKQHPNITDTITADQLFSETAKLLERHHG